jgi:transcription elongation factor Elf1
MSDRTACIHCGKAGFVRREYVIKAGKAVTAFYCGACNRSWEVSGEKSAAPRDNDEPEEST